MGALHTGHEKIAFRSISRLISEMTQNCQKWKFLYKFAPKGKSWGPLKNLNTGAQLQRICDGTVIV